MKRRVAKVASEVNQMSDNSTILRTIWLLGLRTSNENIVYINSYLVPI